MGLARIAIAVLAVVVAFGLLIIGGVALWNALTNKDPEKPGAASPSPSATSSAGSTGSRGSRGSAGKSGKTARPTSSTNQVDNTVVIHCLALQCPVFVAGPGPNDVQFNDNMNRDERRIFNGTRLTVAVQDASTVTVTINGTLQPRGRRGEAKTYEAPPSQ